MNNSDTSLEGKIRETGFTLHEGSLYDFSSSIYCGVLIKETTMRKLVKLQSRYLEEVKKLLFNEADKGNVFPSMWTLHYPDAQPTEVNYIDTCADVSNRIINATLASQPLHKPLVFIAGSIEEAKLMADKRVEFLGDTK